MPELWNNFKFKWGSWESQFWVKGSQVDGATEKSHLRECYTFSKDGEEICIPKSSSVFEIISNESENLDSTEWVAN